MRRRTVRAVLVVVLGLVLCDGVFGERGLLANMELERRNAQQRQANEELAQQNDALTQEARRLREDPSAVEELARGELGLLRDGELLIILHDTPASTATSPARTAQAPSPR
ncbi:MAG: septum formation initiator family protein [Acidobacteria bacterium]|nr:septum formation initiator family protein [Acidobacteriota bacterium]